MLHSFSEVIDIFGGPAAYAREVGMSPGAAKQAKRRNSVAPRWWSATEAAAQKRQLPLTVATLAEMAQRAPRISRKPRIKRAA
jgi:hypothetical protein